MSIEFLIGIIQENVSNLKKKKTYTHSNYLWLVGILFSVVL